MSSLNYYSAGLSKNLHKWYLDNIDKENKSASESLAQLKPALTKDVDLQEQGHDQEFAVMRAMEMSRIAERTVKELEPELQISALSASQAYLLQLSEHAPNQPSALNPEVSKSELFGDIQRANQSAAGAFDHMNCGVVRECIAQPAPSAMTSSASMLDGISPQIYRRKDGNYNLIRAVPPIENLVLTGGGAKGAGLAGALLGMEDAGMLSGLRSVAGSSIGAVVSTWLSVGRDIKELAALFSGNYQDLLKTNESLNKIYPDIQFRPTAHYIAKLLAPFGAAHDTAIGMVKKIDEVTSAQVREYLVSRDKAELVHKVETFVAYEASIRTQAGKLGSDKGNIQNAISQRTEHILNRLSILEAPPDFTKSRQGKMVTFEDIAVLHSLAPEKFKTIHITAHDVAERDNVIFSEENVPTLPIAYAARASMAHPLVATGVSFHGFPWKEASHVFSDGGISSNVPMEALILDFPPKSNSSAISTSAYQRLRAATALMVFDDKGNAARMMQQSPQKERNERGFFSRAKDAVVDGVTGWVASNPEMGEDYLADMQKIHNFGANVLVVQHGNVDTLDIGASTKTKEQAIKLARTSLLEQLKIVRGDSYAVEVSSVKEAFDLLDDSEKARLIGTLQSRGKSLLSEPGIAVSSGHLAQSPQEELLALAVNEQQQQKRAAGRVILKL